MASGPPTWCTRTALVIRFLQALLIQVLLNSAEASEAARSTQSLPVPPRQHVEGLDGRRKRDGEIDVATRDMKLEAIRHQRDSDQDQERQRQHLGGGMFGDKTCDR